MAAWPAKAAAADVVAHATLKGRRRRSVRRMRANFDAKSGRELEGFLDRFLTLVFGFRCETADAARVAATNCGGWRRKPELGISLRSAAEPIDDTSTGKLMEGVLAAFAQFDNDVRSDRMRADMKAALELGRWVFPGADRLLERSAVNRQERDPRSGAGRARATGVRGVRQRTLHEGTAAQAGARLGSDQPPRSAAHIAGDRHAPGNQLYAGIVDVPEYGVRGKRGDFDPLISEDLFYRAQAVLSGRVPRITYGLFQHSRATAGRSAK